MLRCRSVAALVSAGHGQAGHHRKRTVYNGKMITVRQDTLRQDGRDVIREVVDHPDSVAIVAMDDRRRVLMIRQYRHPVGRCCASCWTGR